MWALARAGSIPYQRHGAHRLAAGALAGVFMCGARGGLLAIEVATRHNATYAREDRP